MPNGTVPDPHAGRPVPRDRLEHVPRLVAAYYDVAPDPADPGQRVAFGTSGHRGSSLAGTFNEAHVVAIAAAIADHRAERGHRGPLVLGADTHALSEPAFRTAVSVLAAAGVPLWVDADLGPVPTPVVSHAVLTHNRRGGAGADGIVLTPSHNPPGDGGLKYDPPHGGPAGTDVTRAIQDRANAWLDAGVERIPRLPVREALAGAERRDLVGAYVADLGSVVDLDAVAASGLKLGAHPLGGAAVPLWPRVAETYGLDLEVVDPRIDPAFAFMRCDHDGVVRMDCSSPHAMAGLLELADRYDVAFGTDPDVDRHGIVVDGALMNPNHYLAAAADYLLGARDGWRHDAAVATTAVTTHMLHRVAAAHGRPLRETPVGFKWFVDGLLDGSTGFAAEESAGATLLRRDGTVWTTDKDGVVAALLAAEMTARTGRTPAAHYARLEAAHGAFAYRRSDAPASDAQRAALKALDADAVTAREVAGDPVREVRTHAASGAPLGGLKVVTDGGWFAARPSGTEAIYKVYAESVRGEVHLERLEREAREVVQAAFGGA